MNDVYIIMGVTGSGKTTVGEALAERLNAPFTTQTTITHLKISPK